MTYEIVYIGNALFIVSDEKCKRGDRVLWGLDGFRKIMKRIPARSKKRIREQPEYLKIVREKMAESDQCEIWSPVCTRVAEGCHHIQKRSPANWLAKTNLKRACNACNSYIEQHSGWANEHGHTISKFKKL